MELVALLLSLLGLSGSDSPPPAEPWEGPPGSYTYGKPFCESGVAPPASRGRVRLAIERPLVRRGGNAFARVEVGSGGKGVSFGVEYGVQRMVGGSWRDVAGAGVHGGPQIALLLSSGEAGYCMRFRAPEDAPTGLYRFTRELSGRTYAVQFRVAP
jgi:hypothetical protein